MAVTVFFQFSDDLCGLELTGPLPLSSTVAHNYYVFRRRRLPFFTMPETCTCTCGRAQKVPDTYGEVENTLTFVVMKKVSHIIRRVRRRVVMTK